MSDAVKFFYWAPAVPRNPRIPLAEPVPLGSAEPRLKNTDLESTERVQIFAKAEQTMHPGQYHDSHNVLLSPGLHLSFF